MIKLYIKKGIKIVVQEGDEMCINKKKSLMTLFVTLFIFIFVIIFLSQGFINVIAASAPSTTVSKKTLYAGDRTYQLSLKNTSINATINYLSSNNKVAKINKQGVITAIAKGYAVINVTIKQNNKTYKSSLAVTVKNPYIYITNKVNNLAISDTYQFQVKIAGLKDTNIRWSVNNESYAKIDEKTGAIMTLKPGKIMVLAKDMNSGKASVCYIEITKGEHLHKKGETFRITNSLESAWVNTSYRFLIGDTNVIEEGITWSVSDESIASIDASTGVFLAKAVGTVKVTATDTIHKVSSSCTIKIKDIEETPEDVFEFSNGIITGMKDKTLTEIKIPSHIHGETVTQIGDRAFDGHSQLQTVIFPSTIERVGEYAFIRCDNIKSVIFVDGTKVIRIEWYAFSAAKDLIEFVLPYEVEVFSSSQMALHDNNKLTNLTIPYGSAGLPYRHNNLKGIRRFIIPNTVKSIAMETFTGWEDCLIVVPATVTDISPIDLWRSKISVY